MKKPYWKVYSLLALVWFIICAWQIYEHERVQDSVRRALFTRANDISTSLALVIRSQSRFGVDLKPYLDATLAALTESEDLRSIALLDAMGEITASAGEPLEIDLDHLVHVGALRDKESVTFLNRVAPGTDEESVAGPSSVPDVLAPGDSDDTGTRDDGVAPAGLRRSHWVIEADREGLLNHEGVHWFVLSMSIEPFHAENLRDYWLRIAIVTISFFTMVALGAASHTLERSTMLRIRLARADEMNDHLKNMNLAAAGLAHETKNPLNIVRGLAQMIHQNTDTTEPMRLKARDITEEVDQVTERLSQFMDYSKPLEVALAPTDLNRMIEGVMRVLETDRQEKAVTFNFSGPALTVQADAPMLRQVLFNVLLNALQAVPEGGRVEIRVKKQGRYASIAVSDNGPGVSKEFREDVFRPYVTTTACGTGLGLAIVRQIVLAHRWNIECLASPTGGALFRIDGMHLVQEEQP